MNKLVKSGIKRSDLYTEFLKAMNGILQLTQRELDLLATFIELDVNYQKLPNVSKDITNTQNRKYIMRHLGITADNLSRYITKFKKDGLLVPGKLEDEVMVNKILIPEVIGDRVQITIILKTLKDELQDTTN